MSECHAKAISILRAMAARRLDNTEFWIEFIELYRERPSIWATKAEEYHNKQLKEASYEDLLKKMQEVLPQNQMVDLIANQLNYSSPHTHTSTHMHTYTALYI